MQGNAILQSACTFGRTVDTKVSPIQAASHKGTDGGLELAGRDVRKLHTIKLHAAELQRHRNDNCSEWATGL